MDEVRRKSLLPGFIVAMAAFDLFAVIAWGMQWNTNVKDFDDAVVARMHEFEDATPQLRSFFNVFTEAGYPRAMFYAPAILGLILLCFRQYALGVTCILAGLGGSLIDSELKTFFHRTRPPFAGSHSGSFPSGHSMGAMVAYGLLGYLVTRVSHRWSVRAVALGALAILILAIGFSRIYLGWHYPTDVAGGFAAGGAWLAFSIVIVEACRRRRTRPAENDWRTETDG